MAYLGRPGATAPLTSADIPDNSITAAKIVDATIEAGDIATGGVDTAELADNAVTLAKMAGGTDGQIITYDASGDPVAVGPGTDGQVLTSTGAGSPPAFEDASGWKLLHTRTGTSSDFHMGYDSGTKFTADYNFYMVHISNWYEADTTGKVPYMRVLNTSGVEDSTSVYEYMVDYSNVGSYTGTGGSGQNHIRMGHTMDESVAEGGLTIQVYFANPLGTTHYKHINWQGGGTDESLAQRSATGSAVWASTAAIGGINFFASAGNSIGTFRLYGLGIS